MVSLFGKSVVWSSETELSSLLLCLVMRAGEISLVEDLNEIFSHSSR